MLLTAFASELQWQISKLGLTQDAEFSTFNALPPSPLGELCIRGVRVRKMLKIIAFSIYGAIFTKIGLVYTFLGLKRLENKAFRHTYPTNLA
jgi:hypothetical protein